MKTKLFSVLGILIVLAMVISACSAPASNSDLIHVVVSTTILGDVVSQIGGNHIQMTGLYPIGADPHTFEPRPQDVAAISDAQIIFLNGLELEHSLEPVIESNAKGKVVEVSNGIEVLPFEEQPHEGEADHAHDAGDPHTWMDPNLVKVWVNNIETALSELDPSNAKDYAENAKNYLAQLTDLNSWIEAEVQKITVENRKLVTDHENMGYFIHRYNFTLVGLVVDSLSTGASPSAQDISKLEDSIKEQNVKAIFIGTTVNPNLADQVIKDTGTQLITVDTESLGGEGSDTTTYIAFMKKLVSAIVDGLQ